MILPDTSEREMLIQLVAIAGSIFAGNTRNKH